MRQQEGDDKGKHHPAAVYAPAFADPTRWKESAVAQRFITEWRSAKIDIEQHANKIMNKKAFKKKAIDDVWNEQPSLDFFSDARIIIPRGKKTVQPWMKSDEHATPIASAAKSSVNVPSPVSVTPSKPPAASSAASIEGTVEPPHTNSSGSKRKTSATVGDKNVSNSKRSRSANFDLTAPLNVGHPWTCKKCSSQNAALVTDCEACAKSAATLLPNSPELSASSSASSDRRRGRSDNATEVPSSKKQKVGAGSTGAGSSSTAAVVAPAQSPNDIVLAQLLAQIQKSDENRAAENEARSREMKEWKKQLADKEKKAKIAADTAMAAKDEAYKVAFIKIGKDKDDANTRHTAVEVQLALLSKPKKARPPRSVTDDAADILLAERGVSDAASTPAIDSDAVEIVEFVKSNNAATLLSPQLSGGGELITHPNGTPYSQAQLIAVQLRSLVQISKAQIDQQQRLSRLESTQGMSQHQFAPMQQQIQSGNQVVPFQHQSLQSNNYVMPMNQYHPQPMIQYQQPQIMQQHPGLHDLFTYLATQYPPQQYKPNNY